MGRACVVTLSCFFLAAATVLASCGGGAPPAAVRSKEPTFADATHTPSCKIVEGRNEPFIVDWPADKRTDLEALLKDRIPVVAYDCQQLRLLPDCELQGGYRFIGVTEKEEVVRLENTEEVKANLPFSGLGIVGKMGPALERGSTIDIAYAIIGKRTSTRPQVARETLRGECGGATHFVRGMTLGAFAMQVGSKAKSGGASDIFERAQSSSSRETQSRDGNLAACKTATPNAEEPAAQCGAAIKLELRALEEPTRRTVVETAARPDDFIPSVCPTGLLPTDEGKCGKPTASAAHICKYHDETDCEAQCTRGSATSCALFARMLQTGDHVAKDENRAKNLYDKACAGGAMPACGRLGEIYIANRRADEGRALLKRSCDGGWMTACNSVGTYLAATGALKQDVFTLFKRSCDGGGAEGCWSLGYLFREGLGVRQNDGEAVRYFQLACEGGAKHGCQDYAKFIDTGRGTPADTPRALKLLEGSCDRGFSDCCGELSTWYFTGHGVTKDMAKGVAFLQRACDGTDTGSCFVLGARYEFGVGVPRDPARAARLYERACATGNDLACSSASKLQQTPRAP